MKKTLCITSILACIIAFFVSCKNPVADSPAEHIPNNSVSQRKEQNKENESKKENMPEKEELKNEMPEVPEGAVSFSDNEEEFHITLEKMSEEYKNVLYLSNYAMDKNIENKNKLSYEIESLIEKINNHNMKYKRTEIVVPIEDLSREYSSILYDISDSTGKTFETELLDNYSKYYNFYYQQAKGNISFNIKEFEIGRDKHVEYYKNNVVEKLQEIKEALNKAENEVKMRLSILENSKVKK